MFEMTQNSPRTSRGLYISNSNQTRDRAIAGIASGSTDFVSIGAPLASNPRPKAPLGRKQTATETFGVLPVVVGLAAGTVMSLFGLIAVIAVAAF